MTSSPYEVATPNYHCKKYFNSPDREILTSEGCRVLLQVGTKALVKLHREGLPYIKAAGAYRYSRRQVIAWLEKRAEQQVAELLSTSDMEGSA